MGMSGNDPRIYSGPDIRQNASDAGPEFFTHYSRSSTGRSVAAAV